jgi:glycosyltransferase involved in cell wall biosynthesis
MKVLIVQPIITSYRIPMMDGIADSISGKVLVCADSSTSDFGDENLKKCEFVEANFVTYFGFKFLKLSILAKIFRFPDRILHVADFKYSTLWLFLICYVFTHKKIFLHGQGGYKQSGGFQRLAYRLAVFLSDGYICYTEYSSVHIKTLLPKFMHKKITVVENTLYLKPVESISNADSSDLFYVGRLRVGCGLELLLEAASLAKVSVRIIGTGREEYVEKLKSKYPNAKFYGAVFERERQLVISKGCLAGAYGGDAGLSVVHYMAFGLPVIVHGDVAKHMGPEPTYVENNVSGVIFQRGDVSSLSKSIIRLKEDQVLRNGLALGSLDKFKALQYPAMHEKLIQIMELM